MNHIHFLSSNFWVCEKPKMLGLDSVVVDYSDEICKTCMGLIMAWNERQNNYELALSIPSPKREDPDRPPALARLMWFLCAVALAVGLFVLLNYQYFN